MMRYTGYTKEPSLNAISMFLLQPLQSAFSFRPYPCPFPPSSKASEPLLRTQASVEDLLQPGQLLEKRDAAQIIHSDLLSIFGVSCHTVFRLGDERNAESSL